MTLLVRTREYGSADETSEYTRFPHIEEFEAELASVCLKSANAKVFGAWNVVITI